MATGDYNDPNNPDQGSWWEQNAPPQDPYYQAKYDSVANFYRNALGREGSADEINAWVNGGVEMAAIQQAIYGSPEAQAYNSRTVTPKPPIDEDPRRPPPPPPGGDVVVPQGVPSSGFGALPAPYVSNPDVPQYAPMPTYVPPTWQGGDFHNPTEADLLAMPGYQARLNAGLQARERSAAAQGTILNGGTQKALARYAGEEAAQSYQQLRNNSYDDYVMRYKQFTDAAGMDLNSRTINANENQQNFQNRLATYTTGNANTLSQYLTNLGAKRNAEMDFWSRLQDLNATGAQLAGGSR